MRKWFVTLMIKMLVGSSDWHVASSDGVRVYKSKKTLLAELTIFITNEDVIGGWWELSRYGCKK